MWKIKIESTDVKWHEFSKDQKDIVWNLCVMSFGSGVVFGLFVAFGFS